MSLGTEAFWFNVVLAQQVNTFIIDGASLTVAMGFEEMNHCCGSFEFDGWNQMTEKNEGLYVTHICRLILKASMILQVLA